MVDSALVGAMQDAAKPAMAAGVATATTTGGQQFLSAPEGDPRSSSSSYGSMSYSLSHCFTTLSSALAGDAAIVVLI